MTRGSLRLREPLKGGSNICHTPCFELLPVHDERFFVFALIVEQCFTRGKVEGYQWLNYFNKNYFIRNLYMSYSHYILSINGIGNNETSDAMMSQEYQDIVNHLISINPALKACIDPEVGKSDCFCPSMSDELKQAIITHSKHYPELEFELFTKDCETTLMSKFTAKNGEGKQYKTVIKYLFPTPYRLG